MRRFLFGWFCNLRGFHRGKSPIMATAISASICLPRTIGHALFFRCICGRVKEVMVDTTRGGRIPIPYSWSVKDGQTEVETSSTQGPRERSEPLVSGMLGKTSARIQKEGTGNQETVSQAGEE